MPANRPSIHAAVRPDELLVAFPDLFLWLSEGGVVLAMRGGRSPGFRAFADAVGVRLSGLVPAAIAREIVAAVRDRRRTVLEFTGMPGQGQRWFEARVGVTTPELIVLRDISDRRREERAVRDARARLEVLDVIATSISSGTSVEDVVSRGVAAVWANVPESRVSYSTVDASGVLRVFASRGSGSMPAVTGLVADLSGEAEFLRLLRGGTVVIRDIHARAVPRPVAALLARTRARALVAVPVRHSDELVGVLTLASPSVRDWTEHEHRIATEAAGYLSLAIRDALLLESRCLVDEELASTTDLLVTLLDTLQVGVLVEDERHRIVFANRSLRRMFGFEGEMEELRGAPSGGLLPGAERRLADPESFAAGVAACRASGAHRVEDDIALADGRVLAREYCPFPGPGPGHFHGHLWLYRDLTDELAADAALLEAETRLSEAQRREAMSRLAGGVAHEFRNDLTTILGLVELLQLECRNPGVSPRLDRLDGIAAAVRRASNLTEQLLAFSRKRERAQRTIDLRDAVERMRPAIESLLGEHSRLETRVPREPVHVVMDPGDVDHLLMNLSLNARDAMPEGGCLAIELDSDAARALLVVRDDGHGIDAALLDKVFEPYFTTRGPEKGTGLGLAVVQRIVERARGRIGIESEPGVGTTFEIELPTAAAPGRREAGARESPRSTPITAPAPTRSTVSIGPTGSGETVLVVEDEPAVRELVLEVLEGAGYRAIGAARGDEALEYIVEGGESIDLLLTDVVMPGLDGPELVRAARRRVPDLRVVLMSGHVEDVGLRSGVAAEGFLRKPFTHASILGELRRALDA